MILEGSVEQLNVFASFSFEVCDPSARICRDHRSSLSSSSVSENRTFPRSWRTRAYVCDAATSCSPVRIVCVMPVPLASWAFSRRSSGSSTVTLRTFAIIQNDTILYTSIVYGIPGESNSIKRIKPVKEIPLFREHNPDRGPLLILLCFDSHN